MHAHFNISLTAYEELDTLGIEIRPFMYMAPPPRTNTMTHHPSCIIAGSTLLNAI